MDLGVDPRGFDMLIRQERIRSRHASFVDTLVQRGDDELAEAGVAVDGMVSRRLLESLFHPRTPLHDGAAILSEGRLAAASCVLPLSLNPDLNRELGTRHRAAVGLTEETDAVAVVVSEETGAISLAVGGEIEAVPEPEALRRRLRELVGAPAPPEGAHAPGKAAPAPAGREGR